MRDLRCRVVEVDEIWGYVGKKERHLNWSDDPLRLGDQYVFVAMDSETKLIPSYRIGKRNAENAWYFMQDLSRRLTGPAMAAGISDHVWDFAEFFK